MSDVIDLTCGCGAALRVDTDWLPGTASATIARFQEEHQCRCVGEQPRCICAAFAAVSGHGSHALAVNWQCPVHGRKQGART